MRQATHIAFYYFFYSATATEKFLKADIINYTTVFQNKTKNNFFDVFDHIQAHQHTWYPSDVFVFFSRSGQSSSFSSSFQLCQNHRAKRQTLWCSFKPCWYCFPFPNIQSIVWMELRHKTDEKQVKATNSIFWTYIFITHSMFVQNKHRKVLYQVKDIENNCKNLKQIRTMNIFSK